MGTPLYNTDIIPLTSRPTLTVMDDGDYFAILDTSTGKISKILKTNIMTALKITYDNTSGLTAETVQAALDELVVNLGSSDSAISALAGRLDTLEGTGEGSVAKAIDDALEPIDERLDTAEGDIDTINDSIISIETRLGDYSNKETQEVTASIIVFNEYEPRNIQADFTDKVLLHNRNRFDISTASVVMNGYSSLNIITKENNGIKIVSTAPDTDYGRYAYYTYTSEFDGLLYVSCKASYSSEVDPRNVGMTISKNGVLGEFTIAYGNGRLFQTVNVVKGDTIKVNFYSKTNSDTTGGGTFYYDDIMLSYGNLFDYENFKEPIKNYDEYIDEYTLPSNSYAEYVNNSTNTAGKYSYYVADYLLQMLNLPADVYTLADIIVDGMPLITWSDVYNNIEGVAVSPTGKIGIYKEEFATDRSAFVAWLQANPITLSYTKNSPEYKEFKENYKQGCILEFTSEQTISYDYTPIEKDFNIVCFGDSITGMWYGKNNYPDKIALKSNNNVYGVGFSGCRYTDHPNTAYMPFSMNRLVDSIVANDFTLQEASEKVTVGSPLYNVVFREHLDLLESIDFSNIDYITIFYGLNDWASSVILKSIDDTAIENKQRSNVEDAVKYAILQLQTKFPNLKIIIVTPYWVNMAFGDSNINTNSNGDYLFDYGDYIEKVAKENYNSPVINLYRDFGINAINCKYFLFDDAHPNENTKQKIANRIIREISEV